MNKFTCFTLYILTFITLSFSSYAQTLNDLIAGNQLTIDTSIKQNEQQIVGQPLIVVIEIASQRWFAKGTQIKSFELTDAIILADSEISINGTKRITGQTWSTQTREITIYPKRQGHFVLPEIEVNISVNTEHNGTVEGTVTTEQQHFEVSLPKALQGIEHFIVSPKVELQVTPNIDSEKIYKLGDAISIEVVITSQDSPAMMISPLIHPNIKGLSIYQKTPQVFDQSNRGELIGTRIESFTYIFEQAGEYQLPEQEFFWWDINTNTVEKLIIPKLLLKAGVGVTTINSTTKIDLVFKVKNLFWLIFLLTLIISLITVLYRSRRTLLKLYANITHLEQRNAKNAFLNAVTNQNYIEAVDYLHKYALLLKTKPSQLQSTHVLALNKLAFDNSSDVKYFSNDEAKLLLNAMKPQAKREQDKLRIDKTIKLNNE